MAELASVKRLGWSPYLGKTDTLVRIEFLGRQWVRVQDFWVPAVEAMEAALIETGYENPCDWTGSYLKRYISGTLIWSWHSYGGAIDLDYGGGTAGTVDNNPHLHRRIYPGDPGFGTEFQLTEEQVRAVEAIRTNNGKRVWRWLGWAIGDTMHFEPNCSREDIETGIAQEEDSMKYFLAIFDQWTYADIEAMNDDPGNAGYWHGTTEYYRLPAESGDPLEVGPRGPASDEAVVNLVVHILANGNKDVPTHGYSKVESDEKFVANGTPVTTNGIVGPS